MTVEILADPQVKMVIDRLIDIARSDTGQSARVANFLLSWWDGAFGTFCLIDICNVDAETAEDIL